MDDTMIFNDTGVTAPCPVCGAPNPSDSQFCFSCGRQLNAPTINEEDVDPEPLYPQAPPKPKKPVAGIVITAIIAALLLGACGYLVYDDLTLRNQLNDANATIEKQEKTEDAQKDLIAENNAAITENEKAIKELEEQLAEANTTIEELKIPAGYIDLILENQVAGKVEKGFYVDDNIVVVNKDRTAQLTLHTEWEEGGTTKISYAGSAARIDFDSDVYEGNTTTLTIKPQKVGATLATFTNTVDSSTFQVLVIVTE